MSKSNLSKSDLPKSKRNRLRELLAAEGITPQGKKKTAFTRKELQEIEDTGALTDPETRSDVSDWGVNTFRDLWRSRVFPAYVLANTPDFDERALQKELLKEEFARIRKGNLSLDKYIRASRAGSKIRLNRRVRMAIWAHYASLAMRNST